MAPQYYFDTGVTQQNPTFHADYHSCNFKITNTNHCHIILCLCPLLSSVLSSVLPPPRLTTYRPNITTHPDNLKIVVGHKATFEVVATGDPPLFYRWEYKRGDGDWQQITDDIQDNKKLDIVEVKKEREGKYRCIVSCHARNVQDILRKIGGKAVTYPEVESEPAELTVGKLLLIRKPYITCTPIIIVIH